MGSIVIKKENKKRDYTDEERFALSLQSPFFVKKREDAEKFIKKAGLPEWHPEHNNIQK